MSFPFLNSRFNTKNAFKVFSQLKPAHDYLDSALDAENLKIFAYEGFRNGMVFFVYVVCTVENFWKAYSERMVESRHWYEIIRPNTSCRLHFDVEFYYEFNADVDGNSLLLKFTHFVCDQLRYLFKIDVSYEDVVDLDSSTESKFSRHLIFHLPQHRLFIDNENVGGFVDFVYQRLNEAVGSVTPNGLSKSEENTHGHSTSLMIYNSQRKLEPIFDRTIYTRNRHFRLFMSSKMNGAAIFKLADSCRFFSSKGWDKPSEKEIFISSLVSPFFVPRSAVETLNYGNFNNRTKLASTNISSNSNCGVTSAMAKNFGPSPRPNIDNSSAIAKEFGPSPRPDIDTFVLKLAVKNLKGKRREEAKPHIRSWIRIFERNTNLLVYEMTGCRYCFNIDREHRRNNVKYIVDLDKMMCYQQCHDDDCRGFRSNDIPIELDTSSD